MKQRITLREVAAAIGVHYSTVSLALRDHPRISPAVRRKVQSAALEMGYVPDPALAALNAYRKAKLPVHYQSTIAWIDNWPPRSRMRDLPTFNEYFLGATGRARQLGYEMEEIRVDDDIASSVRTSRVLQNRGVEGLLIAPFPYTHPPLQLEYEKFSAVAFGYSINPHAFHLVTNHHVHTVTLMLEQLVALGYRRCGFFLPKFLDDKVDNAYSMGFWRFFRQHPELEHIEPFNALPGTDEKAGFLAWFRAHEPDAVICALDSDIAGWLQEIGCRVPADVGCVWHSVSEGDTYRSGIHQNNALIGRTALDFLVGMLQRGERGVPAAPIRMSVEGVWLPGQTLRPQEARDAGRRR